MHYFRWRPYRAEYTGSLPNSEVNRRRARSVLDWGTVWEHLRVPPAFCRALELFAGAAPAERSLITVAILAQGNATAHASSRPFCSRFESRSRGFIRARFPSENLLSRAGNVKGGPAWGADPGSTGGQNHRAHHAQTVTSLIY